MKKKLLGVAVLGVLLITGCGAPGEPIVDDLYTQDVLPGTAGTYSVGSEDYPYLEGWYENVFATNNLIVGENAPPLSLPAGGGYFDSAVRIRTDHSGMGLVVLGHNAVRALHSGTGSFDLTGGAYENLFTSSTPIFEVEDMEKTNWIVISGGDYFGYAAEVETFIDASNVALHTMDWQVDMTNIRFFCRWARSR